MRKRRIQKYGNTWIIKLDTSDVKDFELEEGDYVDVEDILVIDRNHKRRKKK